MSVKPTVLKRPENDVTERNTTDRLPPFVTATLPQNPTHLRFWAVLAGVDGPSWRWAKRMPPPST
jgi:hypothetical protein